MNATSDDTLITDRLDAVVAKTESGDYDGALINLVVARSFDPGNIYLVAVERQLKTLLALIENNELDDDRREELIEPMTALIECAVRELARPDRTSVAAIVQPDQIQGSVITPVPQEEDTAPTAEPEETPQDDHAKKELDALKLLYFQQASKFVAEGKYDQAITEVRRVFEVEPDNTIAQQYIARVEQISSRARRSTSGPAATGQSTPPAPKEEPARPDRPSQQMRAVEAKSGQSPQSGRPEQSGKSPQSGRSSTSGRPEQSGRSPQSAQFPKSVRSPLTGDRPASQRITPPASGRRPSGNEDPHQAAHIAAPDRPVSSPPDRSSDSRAKGTRKMSPKVFVSAIVLGAILIAGGAYVLLFRSHGVATARVIYAVNPNPQENVAVNTQPAGAPEEVPSLAQGENPAPSNTVKQTTTKELATTEKQAIEEPIVKGPPAAVKKSSPEPAKPVLLKAQQTQKAAHNEGTKTPPPVLMASAHEPPPLTPVSAPEAKDVDAKNPASGGNASTIPAFVPVLKEPQIVKLESPNISNMVWMPGVTERVIVKVLIDAEGKPVDVQVIKSTKATFEKPVIEAVMNSKFHPAETAVGPVKSWLVLPFKIVSPH